MSQWTLETPPSWDTSLIATEAGWTDPVTGEVKIAIRGLATRAGSANIIAVSFSAATFTRNSGNIGVIVQFNEKVDTSNGATIVITKSTGGTLTGTASAQLDDNTVLFAVSSPDLETILSIGAQTVSGTIVDDSDAVKASKALTLTDNPADTETVTIDSKVYTFKTTLTNTDGYVLIGANKEQSIENLALAINLAKHPATGVGAGTYYATATTLHSTVSATYAGAVLTATAKTAGTAGNSLAISETLSNGAWASGATALSGGAVGTTSTKTVSAGVGTACGTATVTTAAVVASLAFDAADYTVETAGVVTLTFDVAVDVTAGATMVLKFDDGAEVTDITATAAAQTNTTTVDFDFTAPEVAGDLTIEAQTVVGTIVNDVTGTVANKAISAGVANDDTATVSE